ncbi:MAG TPA: DoxX family protein [Pyrinomonadaceae bacterium]
MKIAYWIVTGLMATLMVISAVPDVLMVEGAVEIFTHLGYPKYLIPFIGVAKILGVLAVVIPGLPRSLKEWAYAGLVIDLIGALYSHLSVGDPAVFFIVPAVALALVFGSYFLYRRVYMNPAGQVLEAIST